MRENFAVMLPVARPAAPLQAPPSDTGFTSIGMCETAAHSAGRVAMTIFKCRTASISKQSFELNAEFGVVAKQQMSAPIEC